MPASEERERRRGQVVPFPHTAPNERMIESGFRENEQGLKQFLRIRLGSNSEAEDAAQTVFLRVWERRDSLQNTNVTALLFVTARNLAIDVIRHRRRLGAEASQDEADSMPDPSADAERALEAKLKVDLIRQLLEELPPKCRRAFVSYHLDGREYRETASIMGLTESMVRKYVLRATAHCAARLEELEAES